MWPKPDFEPIPKPKPFKIKNWFSLIIFIYIIVILLTVFIFPKTHTQTTQLSFLLEQGLITFVILVICFCVRLIIYGYAEEKQKFWVEKEKEFHQYWQDWSMQSLSVLQSFMVTPSNFDVAKLIDEPGEIDNLSYKAMLFEQINDNLYLQFFGDIALGLRNIVSLMPLNTTLTVLIQGRENKDHVLEEYLLKSLNLINLPWVITIEYVKMEPNNSMIIDQIIDSQDNILYLLITVQVDTKDSTNFISALLLNKNVQEPVTTESYIRRSMQTNLIEFNLAIKQMQEIQPEFSEIKAIWFSHMGKDGDKKLSESLILSLSPKTFPDIYRLSSCIGFSNHDLSYHAQLILASQLAKKTQQTQLVVAQFFDKIVFSLVSPSLDKEM